MPFFNYPEPDAPVSVWTVSKRPVWNTHAELSTEEVDVGFTVRPDHTMGEALKYLADRCGAKCEADEPLKPKKVFRNGPVTGIIWSDGTKTMTRLGHGDQDDPVIALLNCWWRKMERNRGRSDLHYESSQEMSWFIKCMLNSDEMRLAAKKLEFLADVCDLATKDGHNLLPEHVQEG